MHFLNIGEWFAPSKAVSSLIASKVLFFLVIIIPIVNKCAIIRMHHRPGRLFGPPGYLWATLSIIAIYASATKNVTIVVRPLP